MDGSEERRGGRERDKIDKGREEGWKEGVVKIKLKGERQMNTAEEEGGREGRHMQRRGWEIKGGEEFGRKGKN